MAKNRKKKKGKAPTAPTPREMDSDSSSTPLRNVALAIVSPLLFLLILEGLLALAGISPREYESDPFVSFGAGTPLFVEHTEASGEIVLETAPNKTHIFNTQRFPRAKREGAYRIFCMGGSTTYGRPYDDKTAFPGWLREMLPEADPQRQWEVINAGGISYASYRVAALMEELVEYSPDLFIVYTGQNEFLEERTYGSLKGIPGLGRKLSTFLSRTRIGTLIGRLTAQDVSSNYTPLKNSTLGNEMLPAEVLTRLDQSVGPEDYHRNDAWQEDVINHFRFNLRRMSHIARDAGARIIFVTPASNLRNCSPFKSEYLDTLSEADRKQHAEWLFSLQKLVEEARYEEALAAANALVEVDPRHAETQYMRGQILWLTERYDEAREAFVRACDEDVCPLRAVSVISMIIREIAAEEGDPVVDFEALIAAMADHGTPGEDLFLDHVHPTIEAHRQLALALLDTLETASIISYTPKWSDQTIASIKDRVESRIDEKAHGIALRNLARVIGWAGKREDAFNLAQRAIELAPRDAEAHFMAAVNAESLGKPNVAEAHYKKAIQIELDEREAALRDRLAPPALGDADSLYHYGVLRCFAGDLNGMETAFRSALKLQSDHLPTLDALAWYLATHPGASRVEMDEALVMAQKAADISDHKNAAVLDTLAMVLAINGDLDEAAAISNKALTLPLEGIGVLQQDLEGRAKVLKELLAKKTL